MCPSCLLSLSLRPMDPSKKNFLFFLFLAFVSIVWSEWKRAENEREQWNVVIDRTKQPVAKRLIPNAGCTNGANDHRIRHVSTIKQLGPGSFFSPLFFTMRKMWRLLRKAKHDVCVTSLRYHRSTKRVKLHYITVVVLSYNAIYLTFICPLM